MRLVPNKYGQLDLVNDGGLAGEETLDTVVLTSILLNRRADPEDPLPPEFKGEEGLIPADRQGWVGDVLDEKGRLIGSKLWLLQNELTTNNTKLRAIDYVKQALGWLIEDGYAHDIEVGAEWDKPVRLNLKIKVYLTDGNILDKAVTYTFGGTYEL